MPEYRDIGLLNPRSGQSAQNVAVNADRRGLVYHATHTGEQSLPYMYRSFISFTYGGKKIEDFDLIVTQNDRLDRDGYASFDDNTTTYDNLHGLYYWGTYYKHNSLNLTLSTDGMDQKKLDDFLHWFKAGVSRELILAEHPNRGIMARVSSPPHLSLMPFEKDVVLNLFNREYNTKTTLYKGDISLDLVMDLPHWYAITNLLGKKVTDSNSGNVHFDDYWTDGSGNEVYIFLSEDALKVIYEDGIPIGSMISNNMLLGNGAFANVENQIESQTWSKYESASDFNSGQGARIHGTLNGVSYIGVIAGAIVNANNEGIISLSPRASIASGPYGYFFYSGTAPSPTIISFELTPLFDDSKYIITPRNSHSTGDGNKYNTFTIESTTKQELCFTTPNVYTSYNKAIYTFVHTAAEANMDWETLRLEIRDNVTHPHVRAWAMKCINDTAGNTVSPNNYIGTLKNAMYDFWPNNKTVQFTFNSETGEAYGQFTYLVKSNGVFSSQEKVENVGDMLKSNYIIIVDRNYPDNAGHVIKYSTGNPQNSHRIYHDVANGLSKIQILYKNMYL